MEVKMQTIFLYECHRRGWTSSLDPPYWKIHHIAFIKTRDNNILKPILKPLLPLFKIEFLPPNNGSKNAWENPWVYWY